MNKINLIQANKYENQILALIEEREEYTESDLQGIVSALVATIANDETLLNFEERLARSKATDLQ